MRKQRVQFDAGPLAGGTDFVDPVKTIKAHNPQEVPQAFAALEQAQKDGYWLAGFATYELGYALDPKLRNLLPENRQLPLIHFGVFEKPQNARKTKTDPDATLEKPRPQWGFERYAKAFQSIHDYIKAGDIYQANLTFGLTSRYSGPVGAVYQRLRDAQPVPHGALVELGEIALLSRSPELFFSLSADGQLTTRPMKGTAPRGVSAAQDDEQRQALQSSEKNRAENLMIVDLLRNDMSKVSLTGSVQVPELFAVERYATLHQMTSRITSQVTPGTTIADLFAALFPCGSITGAPKIRAMQILNALEQSPREAYCGSIGWIALDGSMQFNVAIRTLMCSADGKVKMNVGGGIVFDSTAKEEYLEALLKFKFATFD